MQVLFQTLQFWAFIVAFHAHQTGSHPISGCFESHVFLHQPNSPFSDDAVKLDELWSFFDVCRSPDEIIESFAILTPPPFSKQKKPTNVASNIYGISNFMSFYRFQSSPLGFFKCPFFGVKFLWPCSISDNYTSNTPKPCGGNGKRSSVYRFTGLPFLGVVKLSCNHHWPVLSNASSLGCSSRHKRTNTNQKSVGGWREIGKMIDLAIPLYAFSSTSLGTKT